jgi:transitional endoplasmic reticulum ATPase
VLWDSESGVLAPAPDELWRADLIWIGVVKASLGDNEYVVDVSGRLFRAVAGEIDRLEVGNTVEGRVPNIILSVVAEDSIRYLDVGSIDDSVIASFRRHRGQDSVEFNDIGGYESVVKRAKELVELPLVKRENLEAIGSRSIKGVLFTGEPGTGKTLLARAIANHAEATFYEVSGPQIFSKWLGQSEELLRKIFEDALSNKPSIVFFDEIDSVAGRREGDTNEASRRVVAQLLTLMDGFKSQQGVVVVATTNRLEDIDVALLRSGRFDWKIHFPLPDRVDRGDILRKSALRVSASGPLAIEEIAEQTDNWSPADLTAIWTEAGLIAAADDRFAIDNEDFKCGFERVARQRRFDGQVQHKKRAQ